MVDLIGTVVLPIAICLTGILIISAVSDFGLHHDFAPMYL